MPEAEVNAQMAKAPRLPELTVPLGNFRKRKCRCLVYRMGSDCDCALFTTTANLCKFLIDIQRWHSVPGHGCTPECNDSSSAFARSLADISTLQQKHRMRPHRGAGAHVRPLFQAPSVL